MKSLVPAILLCAGIIVTGFFGPWWAPAAFVVLFTAMWRLPLLQAIGLGILCMGAVYLALSIWSAMHDESGLIPKVGLLLGGAGKTVLMLITTCIGLFTGALAAWVGHALGELFRQTKTS